MIRWSFSAGFLLVGLFLLGFAVFEYCRPTEGPGVTVDGPERELSAQTPGQVVEVGFRFHNSARHPARIVGLAEC
ncbi:MAG TPA: hypothetical protein VFA26_20820 [Gemmataceae bacterium]|nr:hypothetical protein [Gemmataceae bacterium]